MTYLDIDGTLTERQRRWAKPIPERIARAKAMIKAGENVIIWSGTRRYAREWCDKYGFTEEYEPYAVLPKPNVMVDNQSRVRPDKANGGGSILGRRKIITPESWMDETDEFRDVD